MPTFYNFRNKNDYLKLKFPNVSTSAQRLFLFGTQSGMSPGPNQVNARFSTISVVSLNSANLSPGKENQALRITPTGTNQFWEACTLNTGVTPRPDTFDFVGSFTRTYRIRFSYRGNASSIGRQFYITLSQRPFGGTGGIAATIRSVLISDTNWNIFENTENLTFTDQFPMLGFGGFAAFGQPIPNYNWTPSDYVEIADFELTWDEQPVTTTSFDNQFIPADTFRQGNLFGSGWNDNNYGTVGDISSVDRTTPTVVFGNDSNWKYVSITKRSYTTTSAIKTDGTLWSWGGGTGNGDGAMGINRTGSSRTPVREFSSSTNWVMVSNGYRSTAAIKSDGTLWSWGENSAGQLGINTNIRSLTPVQEFTSSTNWKFVACGYRQTFATKTDGTLWGWGSNSGFLGTNDAISRSTPTQIGSSNNWGKIDTYDSRQFGVKPNGTLWYWGNFSGAILSFTNASTPVELNSADTDWKTVSYSGQHLMGIKTDGTLWGGGRGDSGQVGNNSTFINIGWYTLISTGDWRYVYATQSSSLAISSEGYLWGWGSNSNGMLGRPFTAPSYSSPGIIDSSKKWKMVAGSAYNANYISYIDPII